MQRQIKKFLTIHENAIVWEITGSSSRQVLLTNGAAIAFGGDTPIILRADKNKLYDAKIGEYWLSEVCKESILYNLTFYEVNLYDENFWGEENIERLFPSFQDAVSFFLNNVGRKDGGITFCSKTEKHIQKLSLLNVSDGIVTLSGTERQKAKTSHLLPEEWLIKIDIFQNDDEDEDELRQKLQRKKNSFYSLLKKTQEEFLQFLQMENADFDETNYSVLSLAPADELNQVTDCLDDANFTVDEAGKFIKAMVSHQGLTTSDSDMMWPLFWPASVHPEIAVLQEFLEHTPRISAVRV